MLTFIIADDHKIFRTGLKMALAELDETIYCVGEARNGIELIELLNTHNPDVILMDVKMLGMDGIEAIKIIRFRDVKIRILALSMFNDHEFILSMMKSGANGYLLKSEEPEEILRAIKLVHEKQYYFNDLVSLALLQSLLSLPMYHNAHASNIKLNNKEIEILKLICQEYTNAEIARMVFLSTRTVEGIRSALLEKAGVRNTVGLVKYAIKHKIVE